MTTHEIDDTNSDLHEDDQDQAALAEPSDSEQSEYNSDSELNAESETDTAFEADTESVHALPVSKEQLRQIIEGALLAAGQSLSIARMLDLFDAKVAPTKEDIVAALQEIEADCAERGFELKEVGTGWRFQVREGMAPWVNRLWEEKPQKYSRALLETLALVAYRQPITRGDIEEIRGVAVSSHIMKTLMERDWVKVVGHRDVPGRPSLYATTRLFLDYFNLKSLDELPSLSEIRDLDELNSVLNLGEEGLGEPDTDVIESNTEDNSDVNSSDAADSHPESVEELEEFVDGEDAFEDAIDVPMSPTGSATVAGSSPESLFDDTDTELDDAAADQNGESARPDVTARSDAADSLDENNTDAVDADDEDTGKD